MRKEILVVDDSKAIRFVLQTILRKHYKVTSVADGVVASGTHTISHRSYFVMLSQNSV